MREEPGFCRHYVGHPGRGAKVGLAIADEQDAARAICSQLRDHLAFAGARLAAAIRIPIGRNETVLTGGVSEERVGVDGEMPEIVSAQKSS